MDKNINKPLQDVEEGEKNKKIIEVYNEGDYKYVCFNNNPELYNFSEQEIQEIMDEFNEDDEKIARVIALARQNPGEWLETNYWVYFRDGTTGQSEEYDWDSLVKNGIETGVTVQGYLCIRSTKEN